MLYPPGISRLDKKIGAGKQQRQRRREDDDLAEDDRHPQQMYADPTLPNTSNTTITDHAMAASVMEKAKRTRIPAPTMGDGMRMAQKKPIIDCLYRALMSLQVNI